MFQCAGSLTITGDEPAASCLIFLDSVRTAALCDSTHAFLRSAFELVACGLSISDAINAFFQLLEGRLGLHPDIIAAIALVIVLALAFLSLYLFSKLRSPREIIHQLGKRLGYVPPYGDGSEILHREFRKEIVEGGREVKIKRLEQRVAELEAEGSKKDTSLAAHQQRSKELEGQLQQAADQMAEAVLATQNAPPFTVEKREVGADTSEQLLRRAEWITACAVGAIRPHGLVAAEAYAAAAIAADTHNLDARRLLFELAKLRRASGRSLPSVVEAVTTFDERAASLFGANLARAADIAEREALQRYRAGLNRSALLVVSLNLALRQETAAKYSPRTPILQEMKTVLLARLGSNGKPSSGAPRFASI